jgi:hypothetical protein
VLVGHSDGLCEGVDIEARRVRTHGKPRGTHVDCIRAESQRGLQRGERTGGQEQFRNWSRHPPMVVDRCKAGKK